MYVMVRREGEGDDYHARCANYLSSAPWTVLVIDLHGLMNLLHQIREHICIYASATHVVACIMHIYICQDVREFK